MQIIAGTGGGGEAWTVNGLAMMRPANAPRRINLFILIRCRIDLSFIGLLCWFDLREKVDQDR